MPTSSTQVAVTGLGLKSPAGTTVQDAHAAVLSGKSQAVHLPELLDAGLPVTFGCPVPDHDLAAYLSTVERRHLDRPTQLGVAAAADALADAGLAFPDERHGVSAAGQRGSAVGEPGSAVGERGSVAGERGSVLGGRGSAAGERGSVVGGRGSMAGERHGVSMAGERSGVYVGTGGGNLVSASELAGHELGRVPVIAVPMIMPNATAARISIRYGVQGPCLTLNSACASGANAIGEAALAIRSGRIDRAVAGGVDSLLSPLFMAIFARLGALSRRNAAPAEASRPFDADRDGFVMGEGAAFLVLERADLAEARGARIYGTIDGYATSTDAGHIVAPRPDGEAAARAINAALADAGLAPTDLGHVNAHGSSTVANDAAEAAALRACFPGSPPIAATKGVTGYLLGAGGAFEAAIALLCAREGLVPPIANTTGGPDAEDLDLVVGEPRRIPVAPVLSVSIGFGGHNAALVLTPG